MSSLIYLLEAIVSSLCEGFGDDRLAWLSIYISLYGYVCIGLDWLASCLAATPIRVWVNP